MLGSHLPYGAKLLSSLASKLNGFAKQSRLVQRVSDRFRPEDFLLTLLDAARSKPSTNECGQPFFDSGPGVSAVRLTGKFGENKD